MPLTSEQNGIDFAENSSDGQLFLNYAKTLRSGSQPLLSIRATNTGPDAGFLPRPRSVVAYGYRYATDAALSLSVKVGFESRISSKKANRWLEKSPASKKGSVSLRSGWVVWFTIASAVRTQAAPNP